eukprot:CCRYP_002360-RA/>CCRYP_002360-RA protein AED:0.05 eAED:0.05 QI:146/1/1/1/0/0.5/2/1543/114
MTRKKCLALLLTSCFATISYSLSCIGAFGCNYVEFITPPNDYISIKNSIGYTGNGNQEIEDIAATAVAHQIWRHLTIRPECSLTRGGTRRANNILVALTQSTLKLMPNGRLQES